MTTNTIEREACRRMIADIQPRNPGRRFAFTPDGFYIGQHDGERFRVCLWLVDPRANDGLGVWVSGGRETEPDGWEEIPAVCG